MVCLRVSAATGKTLIGLVLCVGVEITIDVLIIALANLGRNAMLSRQATMTAINGLMRQRGLAPREAITATALSNFFRAKTVTATPV